MYRVLTHPTRVHANQVVSAFREHHGWYVQHGPSVIFAVEGTVKPSVTFYVREYALTHAEPGLLVKGSADRLMQVLNNLLSNAAKFSPVHGTVEITVVRQGNTVRVAVVDHGAGIPAEFRGRIFQKFAQADSSDTRPKGGTGLGLSIARAIVEKHGGQLDFTSEAGAGATFFFDLPVYSANG